MQSVLQALLALQADDEAIDALEQRRRALDARVAALDRARADALRSIEHAREEVVAEEARQHALRMKIDDHKQLQERNLGHLDHVRKQRDADAAMAQIELTRKVLATEESDLKSISGHLHDLRQSADLHEMQLADTDASQREPREQLEAERAQLDAELRAAQEERGKAAAQVPRNTLSRYERIRARRRSAALFPVRANSCGNCHTAIPMQRRNALMSGRSIDVCEACGVLLYAEV